jgi:hypothetical protein
MIIPYGILHFEQRMEKLHKEKSEIRAIFENACSKQEMLIFVTPYLRFESSFVHIDGQEVHASVGVGKEGALYAMRMLDLKLRFPYKFSYLEAPAKLIGFGMHNGRKTIRFALPSSIFMNDDRKDFRVERVGHVDASFSTPDDRVLDASLINLSTTGALLTARVPLEDGILKTNDKIMITIPVSSDIHINGGAIVRHIEYRTFGVEFHPHLPDSLLEPISRWAFRKREEEYERQTYRQDQSAMAAAEATKKVMGIEEGGILFVTHEDKLAASIADLFAEGCSFFRISTAMPPLRDALHKKPSIAIFHLPGTFMDEKRLVKSLIEIIPPETPVLLLGTDVCGDLLFELGQEWKVTSSLLWAPERAVFLQRLVLGIIRSGHGRGILAVK